MNNVRVNEDPKARLIRELKTEIDRLHNMMGDNGAGVEGALASFGVSLSEVALLKEQLALKEREMEEISRLHFFF